MLAVLAFALGGEARAAPPWAGTWVGHWVQDGYAMRAGTVTLVIEAAAGTTVTAAGSAVGMACRKPYLYVGSAEGERVSLRAAGDCGEVRVELEAENRASLEGRYHVLGGGRGTVTLERAP